ncbi:hypothetical protein AVEN_56644-1 [Araneus ventricosus]|uniref:Uncharacterized protein n=1 Tax=Araneus ventricosus TaxID=182803 RepID=A0A4Y2NMB9_ARAVE|nr:hypothetical protein AVEN_56644-1 [Araneus ventricosus]
MDYDLHETSEEKFPSRWAMDFKISDRNDLVVKSRAGHLIVPGSNADTHQTSAEYTRLVCVKPDGEGESSARWCGEKAWRLGTSLGASLADTGFEIPRSTLVFFSNEMLMYLS